MNMSSGCVGFLCGECFVGGEDLTLGFVGIRACDNCGKIVDTNHNDKYHFIPRFKRRLIIGTLSVDDEPKATLNTFGSDGRTIKERQLNYWIADETTLNISVEDNGDDGGTEITIPLSQLRKVIG
jgi:hypothetical protein